MTKFKNLYVYSGVCYKTYKNLYKNIICIRLFEKTNLKSLLKNCQFTKLSMTELSNLRLWINYIIKPKLQNCTLNL